MGFFGGGGGKQLKPVFSDFIKDDKSGKLLQNDSFFKKLKAAASKGYSLSNSIKNFKIDDAVKNLKDKISKELMSKYKDLLAKNPNFLSKLSNFKFDLFNFQSLLSNAVASGFGTNNEVMIFLTKTGSVFLKSQLSKLQNVMVSRVNLSEMMFLTTLKVLHAASADINYRNEYIRKVCLRHDLKDTLIWIDSVNGKYSYTYENARDIRDANISAKYGAFNVTELFLDYFYKEKVEHLGLLRATYENINLLKGIDNPTNEQKAELTELKAQKNQVERRLYRINTYMNRIMKNVIVYSYSQLDINKVLGFLKKYDINPSIFGKGDKIYGTQFKIDLSDLNVLAPFYKPKGEKISKDVQNFKNIGKWTDRKKRYKYDDIRFIKLRNKNMKKIYLLLTSRYHFGDNYMYNPEMHKRLSYPLYTSLTESIDETLQDIANLGIGRTIFDTVDYINRSLESSAYDFTKQNLELLYDPKKVVYMTADTVGTLPEPEPPKSLKKEKEYKNKQPYYNPKTGKWYIRGQKEPIEGLSERDKPIFDPISGQYLHPKTRKPLEGDWNKPPIGKPYFDKNKRKWCNPDTGEPIPGDWNDGNEDKPPFYDPKTGKWIDPYSKRALQLGTEFRKSWFVPKLSPYMDENRIWIDPVTGKPIEGKWNSGAGLPRPYLDPVLGKWCDPISKKPLEGDWNIPADRPEPKYDDEKKIWVDPITGKPLEGDWNTPGSNIKPKYDISRGVWVDNNGKVIQMSGNIESSSPIFSLREGKWIDPITKKPLSKQPKTPMNGNIPVLIEEPNKKKYWYVPDGSVKIDGSLPGYDDWNNGDGYFAPLFDRASGLWCHPDGRSNTVIVGDWNKPYSIRSESESASDVWVLGYDTIFDIDDKYWEEFSKQYPNLAGKYNPNDPRPFLEQIEGSLSNKEIKFEVPKYNLQKGGLPTEESLLESPIPRFYDTGGDDKWKNNIGNMGVKPKKRIRSPEDVDTSIPKNLFKEGDIDINDPNERMNIDFSIESDINSQKNIYLVDTVAFDIPLPPRRGEPILINGYWCDSFKLESIYSQPGIEFDINDILKMIDKNEVNPSGNLSHLIIKKGRKPQDMSSDQWNNIEWNLPENNKDNVYKSEDQIWYNSYDVPLELTNNTKNAINYCVPMIEVDENNNIKYYVVNEDGIKEYISFYNPDEPFDENDNNDSILWTKNKDMHKYKKYILYNL